MRLNKPIAAAGVVALMALAACGGGSSNNGNPTQSAPSGGGGGNAGAGKDPNAKAPAPAIPGAQKGGTVTVLSQAGLTTMDPAEAYYVNTSSILEGLVTRSLTQYVYDAKTKDMVLIPDLATDLGRPNKDFTSWTFTIRKGIKYEDGTPVTMADLKYGMERTFDRDTFPGGANYSNIYFLNGDKYKGPYKSGPNYNGITIKGQDLTIKMSTPFPDMPYWGSFPAMGPVPAGKKSDPAKYRLHPLATGPYKFSQYTPGESLTLVKNDQWDPNTDPGRRQLVDKFNMKFTVDSSQLDQVLLNDQGQGQTTITYDNILSSDFGTANSDPAKQQRLVTGTAPCTDFWFPDNRKIKDIRVREAIAYGYPYKAAWLAFGEIIGQTKSPGTAIEVPGIPGRVEYKPAAPATPAGTDPAKAKALLKQAGYKPGEYVLKFGYDSSDPSSVDGKNQIVKGLRAAGFNPQPLAAANSDALKAIRADPNAPVNIRSGGWCSDWPGGASWIPPLFGPGGGANYAYFNNKAVNAKIKAIQVLPLAQQPHAWGLLDKEIMTKYFPAVNRGYYGAVMMRGSKIAGMYNDPTFSMPTWKNMYVTK